ncbi:MAG: hypothetical protein ABI818_13400 [Acidobacteriota bacterium]
MRQAFVAFISCAIAAAGAAPAQDGHQHQAGKLGTVAFANSCRAEAQPAFLRGMALLHSFEFGPATDAFTIAVTTDPACGIALWGTGVAEWGNPFSAAIKPATQMEAGRAVLARAAAIGSQTARERDFVSAAAVLYNRFETVDQAARLRSYRDAMGKLSGTYPNDPEAAAFYAVALAAAADPADKTYADQLKAGGILEKLWRAQPQHPGLAHYIIHSYDVPALAPQALAAARRYAAIAPDAPHALHMPSHTFTRLGYWQDSIETNILSAAAARRAGSVFEEFHATDYEAYAYLQSGQDAAARRLVKSLPGMLARVGPNTVASAAPPVAGSYALAAIPARFALERGDWTGAARLDVRPSAFAYVDAITWFARALGAARLRDLPAARHAVDELQKCIDRTAQAKETYWIEQLAIQRLGATAWLALAEGRAADALAAMREAADREDLTEKSAISPGPLAPARELLGEMLLEMKQPHEALAAFEKTMAKEPNRFRGIAGAVRAASASGDVAGARKYAAQLVTVCARADSPGRAELQAARRLAGRRDGKNSVARNESR